MTEIIAFEPIPEKARTLNLQLLKRVGDYALYVSDCNSFEVHKIRILYDYKKHFSDVIVKKKEKIASSDHFGQYAWSYETLTYTLTCFSQFEPFKQEILEKLTALGYTKSKLSERGGKYFKL